jgi:hypothetical protein
MQTQRVLKESSATPGDFEKPSTDQSLVYQRNKRQTPSSYPSNFPLNDLLIEEILQRLTNHLQICLQELVLSNFHSFNFACRFTTHHLNHQYKQNPFPFSSVIGLNLEYPSVIIICVIHFQRNGLLSLCLNLMWDLFLNLIIPKMTRENALSIPVIGLG